MQQRIIPFCLLATALLAGCQSLPDKPASQTVSSSPFATPSFSNQWHYQTSNAAEQDVADLWQLTRQHFALQDEADHIAVTRQIEWYQQYPHHMRKLTENASRYYHYVLNQVLARGLPAEIALLPAVESLYNPDAYSSGHAAGIWQIIPSTARYLGVKRSKGYDGRKDIIDSTATALDYLEKLNRRFEGDWLLTLAAYNAGGGTVSRAMRKNRQAGLPEDYWSLPLPEETRLYVPRLLAISAFVADPDYYAMHLPGIDNAPYFKVVKLTSPLPLGEVARLADTHLAEVEQLNPGVLTAITPLKGPHRLLLPVDKAEHFRQALAKQERHNTQWVRYQVAAGDTLSGIATQFGSDVSQIRQINGLSSNLLRIGRALLIPQPVRVASTDPQRPLRQYQVQPGDTLWRIAQRFATDPATLARWNNMQPSDALSVGKQLRIGELPTLAADEAAALRQIGYQVQNGDSLSVIADRYNVRVTDIRQWNNLSGEHNLIQPGQQLTLFISEG